MDDRPGFSTIVESIIKQWSNLIHGNGNIKNLFANFIRQLRTYKVFENDDNMIMLFRSCTEYHVSNAYKILQVS